jgi:hypothetical protein
MRSAQGGDDGVVPLLREDRFEPELRDALLPPALTERRAGAVSAVEGSRAFRVPGAALVVADAAGAGIEQRVADQVEGVGRDEDDQLTVQVSFLARWGFRSSSG